MRLGRGIGLAVVLVALFVAAPSASAAGLLTQTVSAASAVDKSCTDRRRATEPGWLRSASPCRRPAGSRPGSPPRAATGICRSSTRPTAVWSRARRPGEPRRCAEGLAVQGSELIVQACRLSGSSSTAQLSVEATPCRRPAGSRRCRSSACPRRRTSARTSFSGSGSTSPSTAAPASSRPCCTARRTAGARRQQLRLHHRGPRHGRPGAQTTAPRTPSSRGLPGHRAAERPQQLSPAVRLQRGHEAPRA